MVSVGDMTQFFPQMVAKLIKAFFKKQEKVLDVCLFYYPCIYTYLNF